MSGSVERIELGPLEDITAVSFNSSDEYFYPETFVCHVCGNNWHWPWFATRAQMAAASSASQNSCLRSALAAMPGLKTLNGQNYAGAYAWETGVIYIRDVNQKMRSHSQA